MGIGQWCHTAALQSDRESNSLPVDRKSDALPLCRLTTAVSSMLQTATITTTPI